MSRPAPLPPRCPFQNRGVTRRALESKPQTTQTDDKLCAKHHRFPSHGSLLDEQPLWLDDLLTDPEISPRGISLQRSSSDPVALLEVATSFHGPISPITEEDALSDGILHESRESEEASEIGYGFEVGNCVYGPNSPRQKTKMDDLESSVVTALLKDVPSNPLQYLTVDYPSTSVINELNEKEDSTSSGNLDSESISRRRSGQRSRVRKLQYIAELERSVDILQTLGADLAARVASLFQYRLALSVENKKLRQQLASLQQEKIIKHGQHQSLKNEAERLRMIYGRHRRSKSAALCFGTSPSVVVVDPSPIDWQTLDLGKLSLGGNQVSMKHGLGH
ncbi:basic leucine zipper 34-like isoform X2 [Musa acuminata AAA Group]|uniref:basic leucine zipper 34-like isoform X2 n=1 Tax=Musa acuminata AAA Group TaxID=214697 RepID=UPI0031E3A390